MSATRPFALAWLLVGTVLASAGPAAAEPAWLCRGAKVVRGGAGGFTPVIGMAVSDRFASRNVDLERPEALCASAPGTEAFEALAIDLTRSRPPQSRRMGDEVETVTRFGPARLTVRALDRMLIGVSGAAAAGPAHTCYTVRTPRPKGRRLRVAVDGCAGECLIDVGRAKRLCVPADPGADGALVCHAARLARTRPLRQVDGTARRVTVESALGSHALRLGAIGELCVPVLVPAPPPPDEPPPSDPTPPSAPRRFTLAVEPSAIDAIAGMQVPISATAHFEDGNVADVSDTIAWGSNDEGVARVVTGSAGGVFVRAFGPGTATITAVDPASGVTSSASGGDAHVTVTWPLEKLTLSPHAVTKRPGDAEEYRVIGYFTGGYTLNLTQRVVYASSDPAVATAPNAPPRRSRVHALAAGTTFVSATDPISGMTTTDVGNDATLNVAELPYLVQIASNAPWYGPTLLVGESHRFTAGAWYRDGSEKNITQRCQWSSSDPSVLLAPNQSGDRSRVDAVAPGISYVACTDPVTGIASSYGVTVYVGSALATLQAWSNRYAPLEIGETRGMTAFGIYAPFDPASWQGRVNLSQDVVWTSRDPEIVAAPNTPGARARVVAVGGGVARVYATHVPSGLVSNDVLVPVFGDLNAVELQGGPYRGQLFVPGVTYYAARGVFGGGRKWLDVSSYVLESSDPAVAVVEPDGHTVTAVSPGHVTIQARHLATDIVSNGIELTVIGPLASITLTPATATRGIGEWESFTAIGNYPPDVTSLLTQDLVYESSDPSVAVPDDLHPAQRSRVRTVGAGTATITATHVPSGLTATATLVVLPGTLESITVEPPSVVRNPNNDFSFTAIGHYPDGSTLNVTQIVTWISLAPQIAETTNEAGDRSRVIGRAPGDAAIVATHPSGLSSHDSGGDAIYSVRPISSLVLSPAHHKGDVGDVFRFTLVGNLSDGSTINLTQDAFYWAVNPAIADFDEVPGDLSAARLLAPGTTKVWAQPKDWTFIDFVLYGSGAGAFIDVRP